MSDSQITIFYSWQSDLPGSETIMMLEYNLHRVRMLDWYATTFDGLFFIPLAIENASKVYDEDVDVHVKINKGVVEVIIPSKELINPDMRGLEGLIYEEDVIKELLMMPESSDISYDTDISYTLADSLAESQASVRAQFSGAGINGNPRYNSDDYGREITKYIAMPKAKSNDIEFEFSIGSLRAKEKKWLGPALLVNPLTDSFHIEYSIKSKHSDGDFHLYCKEQEVILTQKEFDLLRLLLENQGRVFTRQMLLDRLWDFDTYVEDRIVDSHIKNLRKKLNVDYIETIRGVGYRIDKSN